jgi:hypothetical protein
VWLFLRGEPTSAELADTVLFTDPPGLTARMLGRERLGSPILRFLCASARSEGDSGGGMLGGSTGGAGGAAGGGPFMRLCSLRFVE